MHEQSQNPDSNPLDDLANDLSDTFGDAPVEMNETVAGDVKGGQIWMKQSAARSVRASALHLEESAAGFVRAGVIDAHESSIGVALAQEMKLDQTHPPLVVAGRVQAQNIQTVVLLAGRVEGNVKAVFTPLTALAAGAGFALAFAAIKGIVTTVVRSSQAKRARH